MDEIIVAITSNTSLGWKTCKQGSYGEIHTPRDGFKGKALLYQVLAQRGPGQHGAGLVSVREIPKTRVACAAGFSLNGYSTYRLLSSIRFFVYLASGLQLYSHQTQKHVLCLQGLLNSLVTQTLQLFLVLVLVVFITWPKWSAWTFQCISV